MQFPLTIVCHTLTSSSYLNGIGRSPLPEREVSSLSPFPHGGPQARQKNYEEMSVVQLSGVIQIFAPSWHPPQGGGKLRPY